ncbi:MAG: alkaline phosphatase [Saprospiraceae bacterium]|jgi:alkaline phosphatase
MRSTYYCLLALYLVPGCLWGQQDGAFSKRVGPAGNPKNVILILAEGLGLTQISAGIYSNGNTHPLERFPYSGLQKANATDALVADAGAAATAISCGVATSQSLIGLSQQKKQVQNIFEIGKSRGYSTGIISSGPLYDPAPAAFVAHKSQKAGEEAIAEAYLQGNVDFFVGGGRRSFSTRTSDRRNLVEELAAGGFVTSRYHPDSISVTTFDFKRNFAALFDSAEAVHSGAAYILPAVRLGMVYLKNHSKRNGFVLVIHYHQISESSRLNQPGQVLSDMKAFGQILGVALDFAAGDGETLVIATGTPEYGGIAIQPGSRMGEMTFKYGSPGHTGALIPVFAYGPGGSLFMGVYENTAVHKKILQALGW